MGTILSHVVAFVLGLAAMFIFKPLVDSGLKKLFSKNK